MNPINSILAGARLAQGDQAIYDANDNVRGVLKQPAAVTGEFSLRTMQAPGFTNDARRTAFVPTGTADSKSTLLSNTLLAGSRAHAAGAHIILAGGAAEPVTASNGVLFYSKDDIHFDCIEAGEFQRVADGDNLTPSAAPIHRADVDLDTMPAFGFRVELSRAEQRQYAEGQLADSVLMSIALGLGRVADRVLLGSILYNEPEAFTVAKAAALGLKWPELRALIGTNGTGAVLADDGTLRAAFPGPSTTGLPAELTPDTDATIIGAWNSAAVAIHQDIRLVCERAILNGDLTLTAFCNAQALLPLPAFWTVGG